METFEPSQLCPTCSRRGDLIMRDHAGAIYYCRNPTCRIVEFADLESTKRTIANARPERPLA